MGCEISQQKWVVVKMASRCEMVSQPPSALYENFHSCKEAPWHTSAISQLRNGYELSTPWDPSFRSRGTILKGVSQLWNHPLAHKCHFAAPYTHFAAAKWLRNLHALKSFISQATPPFCNSWTHFRVLTRAKIMHTIFCFKAWEFRSPALKTVHDSELKQRSYGRLKMTAQTMSGNVAAAPPFRNCWTHFGSLTGAQIMYTIHCFEAWEVRIPTLQTVCKLEVKWRSYSCLKMTTQTMSGNIAPPFCNCWTHFGALYGAQIIHTISHFEFWEVMSPDLQTVLDLELKRKSYGRLKTNVQSWIEMLQPHPISLLLDTFLKHLLELKLCIPYFVLKIRNSGVQCFKWCAIWSWNEEVAAITSQSL